MATVLSDSWLPPAFRSFQQSTAWDKFIHPALMGFATSVLLCAGGDIFDIKVFCLRAAVNGVIVAAITKWTGGHSAGSASFVQVGPDAGKVSKLVEKAVEVEQAVSEVKVKAALPASVDPTPPSAAVQAVSEVNRTLDTLGHVADTVKAVTNGGTH